MSKFSESINSKVRAILSCCKYLKVYVVDSVDAQYTWYQNLVTPIKATALHKWQVNVEFSLARCIAIDTVMQNVVRIFKSLTAVWVHYIPPLNANGKSTGNFSNYKLAHHQKSSYISINRVAINEQSMTFSRISTVSTMQCRKYDSTPINKDFFIIITPVHKLWSRLYLQ
jgi:hypothetical protein